MKHSPRRAVLTFQDERSAIAIPWLRQQGWEPIAAVSNIGQSDDLQALCELAKQAGAAQVCLEDVRARFVEHVWALVRSGAGVLAREPLCDAVTMAALAQRCAEVAVREQADAVAHVYTGIDRVHFERAWRAILPGIRLLSLVKKWGDAGEQAARAVAAAQGIPVLEPAAGIYRHQGSLWHVRHEGGILEDFSEPPPADLFTWTLDPRSCPDGDSEITIDFERGRAVGLNGIPISPVQLLEDLNEIGATNGIGRFDVVDNGDARSRKVYEIPGGTLIAVALRELESLCLDRRTLLEKDSMTLAYGQTIHDAGWFTPLLSARDSFFARILEPVTGSITLRLYKANITIRGRRRAPDAGNDQGSIRSQKHSAGVSPLPPPAGNQGLTSARSRTIYETLERTV